ncbi:sugar ABC transporter ATP-binding protein [Halotalea alkalilenta]|uniref:Ribonucleotide-diphosphate reductase subunit alpha n=1 Tax=Halotalea alkalilenta TaxID=376489 RepID=A0A172YJ06_9GAMM|nr:sugar ABC transporter ATP-binding protein [Halotalea alkalilenta]ANF59208.1 ribonucleotide-diphosphate reductase subunit alpha [Halotalea alkalilenta]
MSLLSLEGISKSFNGVAALSEVSLTLEAGEVLALLGENGAGKSTLMKILCGIHRPDAGEVRLDDTRVEFRNYREASAAGVGIVFQEFSLVPWLTAVENIFLGREPRSAFGLIQRSRMRIDAERLVERLGIELDLDTPVAALSVADQQFVEIMKALSLDARVLVLDEPTAPLTPSEVERLFAIVRALKREGVGMIFISHHMEEIFEICDRVTVLRDGGYIGTREVSASDASTLVEMMVGRRVDTVFPPRPPLAAGAPLVLEAGITAPGSTQTDRVRLRPGEILGFAGLVGSGRSELALRLIGALPASRQIRVDGKQVKIRAPADALALGIGLLPESRKQQGLILPFSCLDNITLNQLGRFRRAGILIDRSREHAEVERLMDQVRVKAPGADSVVGELSGGNQQKVVISRWLGRVEDAERGMRVLIFDEPTRGIDVGAKTEIYALIRALTERGVSILLISSELPEIIGLSDRVAVFRKGHVVAELEGEEIDAPTIMAHATGGAQ